MKVFRTEVYFLHRVQHLKKFKYFIIFGIRYLLQVFLHLKH